MLDNSLCVNLSLIIYELRFSLFGLKDVPRISVEIDPWVTNLEGGLYLQNEYKISLITPVYNACLLIDRAFHSVKRQTMGFHNIQWLLVDDHSSDGSWDRITALAERYQNVVPLRTSENSGSASTPRNLALDSAMAPLIMFLDSDDTLEPDAARSLYHLITEKNVDLADGAFCERSSKRPINERYVGCREGKYSIQQDADEFFPISHPIWTKIYKRDIIERAGLRFDPSLRNGEDSLFIYQYLLQCNSAWHTNKVLYCYTVDESSVSHNRSPQYFIELARSCDAVQRALKDTGLIRYCERFTEETAISSVDGLCDTKAISDDMCLDILPYWYPFIKLIADNKLSAKVPIGEILTRDAARDDYNGFCANFISLRRIYDERRAFAEQVFSSRGWRLITAINRFLGR